MTLWKVVLPVVLVGLAAARCHAADERISVLLRSILSGGPVPTSEAFSEVVNEDYVRGLSQDSVKQFLPLARTLLHDPRPEARRDGLLCFLMVTQRFSDSEPLLKPYIPDLLGIVDDHASPLRRVALLFLGNTAPRVSPKTLAYMAAHLADHENAAAETATMAWILLRAGSDPLTHTVVEVARKQNKPELTQGILRGFRKYRTKNSEALAFVGEGLDSHDEWTCRTAVEYVADLPVAERSRFRAQLSRISVDAAESAETRLAASRALEKEK